MLFTRCTSRSVEPKPAHLGATYAAQFSDDAVVAAYRCRPPYPEAVFDALRGLLVSGDAGILDVGCGRGNLTLPLAAWGRPVDAVDPSGAMLREARRRAGDAFPRVRWIESTLEDSGVVGPYALAVAGESLHWTEWSVTLPLLARVLAPGARLAIATRTYGDSPWHAELSALIPRYSTSQEYAPYDLVDELEKRGLFSLEERIDFAGVLHSQTLDDYVESFHSANGFSRDRMDPEAARAFDDAVRQLARAYGRGETVALEYGARIDYGRPRTV